MNTTRKPLFSDNTLHIGSRSNTPQPETITIQEAWEAAGGNPGVKATKAELLDALRMLDAVCDEAEPDDEPTPDHVHAIRLADKLADAVQTYPQISEDEPGGYMTELDQVMDESSAALRRLVAENAALRKALGDNQ